MTAIAFSPDGKLLATGSSDKAVRVWNIAAGTSIELARHSRQVNGVAFFSDGTRLVSGGNDGRIIVWDLSSNTVAKELSGPKSGVLAVAVSWDGRYAASGCSDHTLQILSVETGKTIRQFTNLNGPVSSVTFLPEGRQVLAASGKQVALWDMSQRTAAREYLGHTKTVDSVAITLGGARAVSASDDRTIKLWDLTQGTDLRTFAGHVDDVRSVAIDATGTRMVSGSNDRTVRVWDVGTGKQLQLFIGHTDSIDAVALSPDGQWAASASDDHTVRLWPMPPL